MQPHLHQQQQQQQHQMQMHLHTRRASTTTSASIRSHHAPSIRCSRSSSTLFLNDDALPDGALIGVGHAIQGEHMQLVNSIPMPVPAEHQPATSLVVQRRLGTGSYAVVYLARELLSPPHPRDSFLNYNDDSGDSCPASPALLGREFAVKCLSKSALDADGLEAQMQEATIQQSLPAHPNIVTLYQTLETSSYLLLVMEYVPGSDLFYFLEQARDHEDLLSSNNNSSTPAALPPTPSQLATLHPSQILSPHRLRLIASMFGQMCDAVAHCHASGVFHRDIKPENFMVTETTDSDNGERKVVVKLTDFGLATSDVESLDMDCGSAPYMSFECHNNLTPAYATAPADVWSLGIVLINMLYHANPWLTPASSECSSFDFFLREPIAFFMDRFPGMTQPVATFFSQRVFCLLDPAAHHPYPSTTDIPSSSSSSSRVGAAEFGTWIKEQLVPLLGPESRRTSHSSGRPRSPQSLHPQQMSISQPSPRSRTPSPVHLHQATTAGVHDPDVDNDNDGPDVEVRSASSNSKRRKRAARGHGHGSRGTTMGSSLGGNAAADNNDDRLTHLADAAQRAAREASSLKGNKSLSSIGGTSINTSGYGTPSHPSPVMSSITISSTSAGPELRSKKSAKWAGIFKRDSGSDQDGDVHFEPLSSSRVGNKSTPTLSPRKSTPNLHQHQRQPQHYRQRSTHSNASAPSTSVANNVTSVIRSLEPVITHGPFSSVSTLSAPPSPGIDPALAFANAFNPFAKSADSSSRRGKKKDKDRERERGRESRPDRMGVAIGGRVLVTMDSRKSTSSSNSIGSRARSMSPAHYALIEGEESVPPVPPVPDSHRSSLSPIHPANGGGHGSGATSRASWRTSSSASSIGGSSTFTRFSNASVRSVSTANTSLSSGSSWRQQQQQGQRPKHPGNIKHMEGVPWELGEVPRQQFSKPKDHVFNPPPVNSNSGSGSSSKRRHHHHPSLMIGLGTIDESARSRPMSTKEKDRPRPATSSGKEKEREKDRPPLPPPPRSPLSSVFFDQPSQLGGGFGMGSKGGVFNTGLTIDPVIASSASTLTVNEGTGSDAIGVLDADGAALKPPKTPTSRRLWNWRKQVMP